MSEHSISELLDDGSNEYFEMGADDPALQPEIADPGEYELEFRSFSTSVDKNGVGQVSLALEILADGDLETVWHRLGLPSPAYNNVANRIRVQEILNTGEAFKIPGGTVKEVLSGIEEGEGKGNSTWAVLGVDSYTNPETEVTVTRNVVEKFITK